MRGREDPVGVTKCSRLVALTTPLLDVRGRRHVCMHGQLPRAACGKIADRRGLAPASATVIFCVHRFGLTTLSRRYHYLVSV